METYRRYVIALTPKSKKLLCFIDAFIRNHGFAPSYEEMLSATGRKSKGSLKASVDRMIRDGFLSREANRSRGLAIKFLPESLKPTTSERIEGDVYPFEWREMKFVISPRVPEDEIWVNSAGRINKIVGMR